MAASRVRVELRLGQEPVFLDRDSGVQLDPLSLHEGAWLLSAFRQITRDCRPGQVTVVDMRRA